MRDRSTKAGSAVEYGTGRQAGERLLEVRGLKTHFDTRDGMVKAVDEVDFHVDRGEVLGIVGESGCGKSVTSLSIMGLIGHPGKVVAGEILFGGRELTKLKKNDLRKLRGENISMIFQQPTSALNPVYRAGMQIKEMFELHRDWSKEVEEEKVIEMLAKVGIPDPERRAKAYPHELSGGMAQRIMIAMALACQPELLIADEPTTALDVTVQARIIELINQLQERHQTAVLYISHDLSLVKRVCDRTAVMYAGRIAEIGDSEQIFHHPEHPYTRGLLEAIPSTTRERGRLAAIEGTVPELIDPDPACRFAGRCPHAATACRQTEPELHATQGGHAVACFLHHPPPGAPAGDVPSLERSGK